MRSPKTLPPTSDENDIVPILVHQMEEDIALGYLKPRERLVESEMMLKWGAKRNQVRQALAELENMGLVRRPMNKGAVVRDFTPDEINSLYIVREVLEAKAVDLITFPVPESVIEELRSIQQRHSDAGVRGDLRQVFRENLHFHSYLFSLCNAPELVNAIKLYQMKSHVIRSFGIAQPKILKRVTAEHFAMIDALAAEDRSALKDLVTAHIRPAKDAYIEAHMLTSLASWSHRLDQDASPTMHDDIE